MKILRGTSIHNPIVVSRSERELNKMTLSVDISEDKPPIYGTTDIFVSVLDVMFGPFDGSYFIVNETELIYKDAHYKVFYIEDKDGERHSVYFRIDN